MNARERLIDLLGLQYSKGNGANSATLYLDLQHRRWLGVGVFGMMCDVTALVTQLPMGEIPVAPSSTYLNLVAVHLGDHLKPRTDYSGSPCLAVYFLAVSAE